MTCTVVDVDATTRTGRAHLRSFVREVAEDRAHDPYGSGMLALGALVDVLWEFGEGVPSAIATPGCAGGGVDPDDYAASELLGDIENEHATTDDVRYTMFVVSRYLDIVTAAGRNY